MAVSSLGPQPSWAASGLIASAEGEECILVAVGPGPLSDPLVRWTHQLAGARGVRWMAVHVETAPLLPAKHQELLDQNLSLARELGAEIVLTHDEDIPSALVRVAARHHATLIVIGKPRRRRGLDALRGGSHVDRLLRMAGSIDICVVPARDSGAPENWRRLRAAPRSRLGEYWLTAGVVAVVTAFSLLMPESTYPSVGLVYLLAVILLSLRVGRGPLLMAGILSAWTWEYIFIPPHFKFQINSLQDRLLFSTYFVVALVSGQLAARFRAQAVHERLREERATALFQLTRALTGGRTLHEAVSAALRQADEIFSAQTSLMLAEEGTTRLAAYPANADPPEAGELAAAAWAFRHRRNAGRFTDMPMDSVGTYVPLLCGDHAVGVLGLKPAAGSSLTVAQRDLVEAFARQLALIVDRENLRAASEREKLLAESEKLHRALLDSVSHELRTPLAVITAALEHLDEGPASERAGLLQEMRTAARRLNRLVANLLDQTRLESGALRPRLDWCDAVDLVNAALADAGDALAGHSLEVKVPEDMPTLRADFALTEQALGNLLLNAASHTPAGTPIIVSVGLDREKNRVFVTVADRGPGLPAAIRGQLFRKFVRGDAVRAGGLGLGLSIARGFVDAQGGDIAAEDNPGGGARFSIYLPHETSQPAIPE